MNAPSEPSKSSAAQRAQFSRALHRAPAAETSPGTTAGSTSAGAEVALAPRPHAPRVKPVRVTVDLAPDLHNQLKVWAATESVKLSEVFRALAGELLTDAELAERVRRTIDNP